MFDHLDQANNQPPSKTTHLSNDELLIPISHNHTEHLCSSQHNIEANTVSQNLKFSNADLTINHLSSFNRHDINIPISSIINESETILPDVTCVTPGNYNMPTHSYVSNQDGENQPLLKRFDSESTHVINNSFVDDAEFNSFIREVEQAIENGFLPERIYQGSSGSYFAKNSEGNVINS